MRVAIVAAVCAERDAISAAAASQAATAVALPEVESVDLFSEYIGRPTAVPSHVVPNPWALHRHPRFRTADVAVFHWGIYSPLFDAMTLLCGAGPHPVLMFHNMTPVNLVEEPDLRQKLDASVVQLAHLASLPIGLWTYGEENRHVLGDVTGRKSDVRFVPFPIVPPRPIVDRRRPDSVRLLSIGRFARAKGTDVLIEAVGRVVADSPLPLSLELVGNPAFSYPEFVARLDRRIAELRLEDVVSIASDVGDEELWDRLERAHVVVSSSRHEGLCVPVVEAYLAGCRVVAADGGNLRYIVQPPDPVVPAGDDAALATALKAVIDDVVRGRQPDWRRAKAVTNAYSETSAANALSAALAEIGAPGRRPFFPWPAAVTAARHPST